MISLRSEITKKLLNYFFINPHSRLYVNELSRKLDIDKRNLVKKIKELETEGIFESQARGNLKLYGINKNYHLYSEYKRIIMKTLGLEEHIRRILKQTQGVKEAYLYGSYAKNALQAHSDIDLLVVGKHSVIELQKNLSRLQSQIDREINSSSIDEKEFKKRLKNEDPFIRGIFKQKHIRLI